MLAIDASGVSYPDNRGLKHESLLRTLIGPLDRAVSVPLVELRKRLALVAAAYLAIFLAGGFVITQSLRTWTEELDHRREYLATTERLATLRSAYLDQETGVRGFLLSGDAAFLEPYNSGIQQASSVAGAIRTTLVQRGIDPAPIDNVIDTAQQWRDS